MRLTVIGATGGVGRHLVDQALEAGHEVRALVRTPSKVHRVHERLWVAQGDVTDGGEALASVMKGSSMVLSALGSTDRGKPVVAAGTAKIVEAARAAGVRRLALISSIGVGDSKAQAQRLSFVFGRIIMPLFLKRAFEDLDAAEGVAMSSGLATVRVRPSGLTNGPRVGRIVSAGPDGDVPQQISRADVAGFMLSLVEDTHWDGKAASIGGT